MNAQNNIQFLLIDLFCGAGGTTTGAEKSGVCKVIAAVNHDPLAIESHAANYQDVLHLTEDVLLADTGQILQCVLHWKSIYPNAKVVLWMSAECTNHSNAKGGLPRDADSRSLSNCAYRYLDALPIDAMLVENIREIMCWGDVDENGKPISKCEGRDYVRWVKNIESRGYIYDWKFLCAADFGGVTIRTRYFAGFYRPGFPFAWPQPTHAKRAAKGNLFQDDLKPWRPVSEVLDFSDLGESIFERPRPLVDKTLQRILAGLRKFHTQPSIMVNNTPGYCASTENPIGTLTTVNSKSLLTPILQSYYSGAHNVSSANQPAPTVPTKDRFALVSPFIYRDFKSPTNQSVSEPAGTVLCTPKMNLCSAVFLMDMKFRNVGKPVSDPAPTLLTGTHHYLTSAFVLGSGFDGNPRSVDAPAATILASRRHHYLTSAFIVNPQYRSAGSAITAPAPTVIAKQKSYPLALASAVSCGSPRWKYLPTDSAAMIELKAFMRSRRIADVYMRMLKVVELKRIQGFPDEYVLRGSMEHQKKFIGNSVETNVVAAWFRALAAESYTTTRKSTVAA